MCILATLTMENLATALLVLNKRTVLVNGFLRLMNTGLQLLPSILVTKLLKLLESTTSTSSSLPPPSTTGREELNEMHMKAFGISCLLCSILVLKGCVESTYFYRSYILGVNVKVYMCLIKN
jgi:hypothetical protein